MSRKPRAIILDSWAIIAYLEGVSAAEKVADIIADAHDENVPLFMCVINAGELWTILAREVSESDANRGIHELQQLGVVFVDVDWTLAHEAARIRAKYKMSLPDCFAAALTQQKRGFLVTGNGAFTKMGEDISITWVDASQKDEAKSANRS